MPDIQTLPLSTISTAGLQVRIETNRAHVDDLAEFFGDEDQWPAKLPPVIVFFDGTAYHCADGHHRLQAAQEAGCTSIPCEVRKGEKTAALWYAVGANADHGLRRTNDDKRRAVLTAYRLDSSLSDNAIAKRCRVTHPFVGDVLRSERKKPSGAAPLVTVSSGGEWIAAGESAESTRTPWDAPATESAHPAVAGPSHLAPMAGTTPSTPTAAPDETAPEYRIDTRGRKINVARIGKSKPAADAAAVDALTAPCQTDAAKKAMESLDFFAELDKHLAQAAKMIDTLGRMEGAELLRSEHLKMTRETRGGEQVERYHSPDLTNLRRELGHWQPHTACPYCVEQIKPGCGVCKGLGWVTQTAWDRCPERVRTQALETAAQAEPEAVAF